MRIIHTHNLKMNKKDILVLILKVAGFDMAQFETIRANGLVGYQFEAHIDGRCQFQIATDSFESAVQDTVQQIYNTNNLDFPFIA